MRAPAISTVSARGAELAGIPAFTVCPRITLGRMRITLFLGTILGLQRHQCGGKATLSLGTTRVREAMACPTSAMGT
jgi:hypothetical protein